MEFIDENPELNEYGIVLPCEPKDFGQFVSSLLGKPQIIERSYEKIFEIKHSDIVNTFQLVNQRINQQNESTLIQFTVKIIYHDDSSVLLNSLEEFEHYNEIRPLESVGVVLSWVYLVTFKNKRVPEKQSIDLSFRSEGSVDGFIAEDGIITVSSRQRYRSAGGFLRISHTERTWGVDIESLLTGHVKTLFKKQSKTALFINRYSDKIGSFVGSVFFVGALLCVYITTNQFINSYLETVKNLNSEHLLISEILIQKIDLLTDIISKGVWPRFVFAVISFIVISAMISIILGVWVTGKADKRPQSFVLLSKKALEHRERMETQIKRDWAMFYVSIIISIVTGIVSNILFNKYFGNF